MKDFNEVLSFWFEGEPLGEVQMTRWWKKNEAEDQRIKERFSGWVDAVFAGECDEWLESPEGRLAAIICLDQFPRNIYRGQPESFQFDKQALKLTQEGLTRGQFDSLEPLQQSFFLMPLMHSEKPAVQEDSIHWFTLLAENAPEPFKEYLAGSAKFAMAHKDIVDRFGRYPHRNEILGRESTDEEVEFLSQPGSSF